MTNHELDQAILEESRSYFLKTAMIIVRVNQKYSVADELIFQRIRQLVATGKLEGAGDINKWRYSELRLSPHA